MRCVHAACRVAKHLAIPGTRVFGFLAVRKRPCCLPCGKTPFDTGHRSHPLLEICDASKNKKMEREQPVGTAFRRGTTQLVLRTSSFPVTQGIRRRSSRQKLRNGRIQPVCAADSSSFVPPKGDFTKLRPLSLRRTVCSVPSSLF